MFSILNVRSNRVDDLTTRARIRDAAVRLFGTNGYDRTTIRAIADEAHVSAALVIHQFGSKDELRAECDRYVVEELFEQRKDLSAGAMTAVMRAWLSDLDRFRPFIDYLSRMLTDETPAADALFDALLASTADFIEDQVAAGVIRPQSDPDATAVYLTIYGIVPLVMQRQLARALGAERLTTGVIRRSTLPILDLYTHGLYTDDRFLTAARDALARTAGPSSDKGENDPNQDPDPPQPRP